MQIKVEILTQDAFQSFGRVLGEPEDISPTLSDAVSNVWLGFSDLMGIGEKPGQQATFLKIHTRPGLYDKMEKHESSAEVFIPLQGQSILLVAPRKEVDRPVMDQARAFLMDGSKGVLMHAGTWHAVPYTLTDVSTYLVLVDPTIIARNDLHVTLVEPIEFILPEQKG
jgi:ureidoglycolate lyase